MPHSLGYSPSDRKRSLPLTIGQKLDLYVIRKVHVSDILEPMVRALWWKRWEWRNAEIADDCGSDADLADLRMNAETEVEYARIARAKIIRNLWNSRCLNRLVEQYAPAPVLATEIVRTI